MPDDAIYVTTVFSTASGPVSITLYKSSKVGTIAEVQQNAIKMMEASGFEDIELVGTKVEPKQFYKPLSDLI